MYLAIVNQPTVSNVFLVNEGTGVRVRLVQQAESYCEAYADGYIRASDVDLRIFSCDKGDATQLEWEENQIGFEQRMQRAKEENV